MRFKTELFDEFQLLFESYKWNDHQIHCVIDFNNKINKEILKKSVIFLLDIVPILGCAYVEDKKAAYWKKVEDFKWKDVIKFVNYKEEFEEFLTSKTNEFVGPQIKFCLLDLDKDSLAIVINHMVCDAAGFKQCVCLLSHLYSKLIEDGNYSPNYKANTDRSIVKINREFTLIEKIRIIRSLNQELKNNNFYKFPMVEEKENRPFNLTHKINKKECFKIENYCKKHNVTINDVFLAAYYRVLYRILDVDFERPLTIPIMVDMRRYLKNGKNDSIYNFTSSIVTGINYKLDDSFNDTVKKINKYMILKKNKFIGVKSFCNALLVSKLFNYEKIKKLIKKFENPLICMSNIGVIDSEKILFKGVSIKDISMFGSIKYPPYFQLSLSSYDHVINLCVSLYGTSREKENIERFFQLMDDELTVC
jgi:NRPS condensation-like uncharacterized protein